MKVVVVGGGIAGLSAAYALTRAGAEVTVIERDRAGEGGASLGNAGWITPGVSSIPLPAPGVMKQAFKWMFKADSPLLIRPRLDPGFLLWSWGFWRACSPDRYRHGLRALVEHNRPTLAIFDEWKAEGVEFEMHSQGLLYTARSPEVAKAAEQMYSDLASVGYESDVQTLDRDAIHTMEPALSDAVVGGLVSRNERHVRPNTVTRGLADYLTRTGATVLEGTKVEAITGVNGGWQVRAGGDALQADAVVVAAGMWTKELMKPLGYRIPLEAAKGYSVTAAGEGLRPRYPLYMLEAKLGCSPFRDAVRLAGTLELAGMNMRLTKTRFDAILRAGETYLRDWRPVNPELEWAGLRPFVPDGLPVVGAVPGRQGLYLSTGHGMAGMTMAAASGRYLAPLVLEGKTARELEPLSPARF